MIKGKEIDKLIMAIKEDSIKQMIEKYLVDKCGRNPEQLNNFPVYNKREFHGCDQAIKNIKTVLDVYRQSVPDTSYEANSIGMLQHAEEDKENFAISLLVAIGLEKLDIDRRDFIYMRSIKEKRIKLMIEKHLAQGCGGTMQDLVDFPVNNKEAHPNCQEAIKDIKTIRAALYRKFLE